MSTGLKIRILLFLLTICFAGTAITVSRFYNKSEILLLEGSKIEKNLHKKEAKVQALLGDSIFFNSLKEVNQNEELAHQLVVDYGKEEGIFIYTYSNNDLVFWGSNYIVPKTDVGMDEGSSIIDWENGWYEAFRKKQGSFSVVCLIPIKADFPLKNRYLENKFSKDLIASSNLEVADYKDSDVYNLRNNEGKYLLSLKVNPQQFHSYFSGFEFFLWVLTAIVGTICMNVVCQWIADKGKIALSILVFAGYFLLIRYLDLKTLWLATHFYGGIFDPKNYASSFFAPSLGAFFLNVLTATWLVCYVYSYRDRLQFIKMKTNRFLGVFLFIIFGILIYLFCWAITDIFAGLIINSSINFDVTNVLKLNLYSWIGIVALCLVLFDLYLIIEIFLIGAGKLNLSRELRTKLFLLLSFACLVGILLFGTISLSFFLLVFIIYLRGWRIGTKRDFNLAVFVAILLLFSTIASKKQGAFHEMKRESQQILALQKLESSDDPNAVLLFLDIEKKISTDKNILEYFRSPTYTNPQLLNETLRKNYFGGYLSRYDFNAYIFDEQGNSSDAEATAKLNYYKDRVIAGSMKVSRNFYRLYEHFGYLNYFALLPIQKEGQNIGIYLIELKNKALGREASFPAVLVDGNIKVSDDFENYSYAFYKEGKLQMQHGLYVYPPSDIRFPKSLKQYKKLKDDQGYTHLTYTPDHKNTIVLSTKQQSWWKQLASLSFLFLVFLVFSIFAYSFQWIFSVLRDYDFNLRNLRWTILISQNRILYSTRIQAFVVSAVVGTLVIAGIITYFSLSGQFRKQQEEQALERVSRIAGGLESRMFKRGYATQNISNEQEFNLAAEKNASDLNLYNKEGTLIYTTQPKIYDLGLTSRQMNAEAWLNVDVFLRDEYINREKIGDLNYLVSYTPLKNDENNIIAYLGLPFFSYQKELDNQVGLLLNTIINVYALVIVALGLFAAFVANQVTAPLTLVQRSLARTTIGKKNEPIFWKRNDEIGSLIKEYNNMIVALDHSANQIMRSERESAWREMAKQVAHEIKNPLTPLRLGIQLLNRAWLEKDPKFDQKFDRFSKSFIEQIESLNHIASEFSNFAKMPDTHLEDVDILEIIEHVISIYDSSEHLELNLETAVIGDPPITHADRDQLLRTFNNLIKNAIEARVPSRVCKIVIQLKILSAGDISIAIKDNGKGIDEIVRAKIFQPNFTTKSSGTGLGLAFVKQTIESIGGTIEFRTQKGVGTTFFILIPSKRNTV